MPSAAKIFGAALLNALGKGVEGYGQGAKDYRNYALDQLTKNLAIEKARPSLARNVEAYMAMTPEQQAAAKILHPDPAGPQQPSRIQEAGRYAYLKSLTNRTPEQEAELEFYTPKSKAPPKF